MQFASLSRAMASPIRTLPLAVAALIIGVCTGAPQTASARPEMAGQTMESRFSAMDTDTNGLVSKDEFFAAQPNMKEAAFSALDTDGDGSISLPEWLVFSSGHGKDGHSAMEGEEGAAMPMGGAPMPKGAPDLIMPPSGSK